MADPSPRRDPILDDLLEIENFPQALKHLNRKLKKNPKSSSLLGIKAHVLHRMRNPQGAFEQCEELVKATPPISDLDELFQIHQTLWHLSESPDFKPKCTEASNNLWKRAVQVQTNAASRVEIAKDWAQIAVSCSQWAQVQQAAILLHRDIADSDSEKRKYWFWQIVAQYLSSQQTHDDKMRSMLENLACMNLNKALSDMPIDSETAPKTASRWIDSRSELELFGLTSGVKQTAKAIELLDKKSLGPANAPMNDKWGALQLDRVMLASLERKSGLARMSQEALDHAQKTGNEWKQQDLALWMDTVTEGLDLEDKESVKKALDFAISASRSGLGSRSARLASLNLLQRLKLLNTAELDQALFEKTFKSHIEDMMTSPILQNDLDGLLECWSQHDFEELPRFRDFIKDKASTVAGGDSSESAQLKWITAEANALGFDLKVMQHLGKQNSSERPEQDSQNVQPITQPASGSLPVPLSQLVSFVTSCIQLYKVARLHTAKLHKFDPDPGDAALVLAAQALSWATEITRLQRYNILGVCLLQFLLEESEYNSKARMMALVRFQELGLHSLAAKAYTKLGVKGILHESCDPMFFSRLSVYHPKATRDFRPDEGLAQGLKFYADSLGAATDYQSVAMDEQNYGSVLRFQQFHERLRNSATRRLLWLEQRRARRIIGVELENDHKFAFDVYPPDSLHQSSSSEFQSAQTDDKPLDVPANCGLPVNKSYLAQLELADHVLTLLRCDPSKTEGSMDLVDRINAVPEGMASTQDGITYAQARCYAITRDLVSLARVIHTTSQTLSEVETLLTNLLATLEAPIALFEATEKYTQDNLGLFPTWQTFETCYSEFDLLKGVLYMCAGIQTTLKVRFKKEKAASKEMVEAQLKQVKSVASSLHRKHRLLIADWRKRLGAVADSSPEGIQTSMLEHHQPANKTNEGMEHLKVLREEVVDLIGSQSVSKILGSLLQSGIEACDSYLSLPEELSKAV